MGLKKLSARLSAYFERLETGQGQEIKPDHVRRVLEKLCAKEAELAEKLAHAETEEKRQRLHRKQQVAQEHIARAKYLLAALTPPE